MCPACAPFVIRPIVGLSGPLLVFAVIGLIVLIMLRWRLPSDTPRFSARGAVGVYPTSAGSPAAAGNDRDEDSADPSEYAEELSWTDRRVSTSMEIGRSS